MPAVDQRALRALAEDPEAFARLELAGIEEAADAWRLGAVAIAKEAARWSYGLSAPLHDASHFRRLPFRFEDLGAEGVAAVWHAADHPEGRRHAHEVLAGWVPPARAADLAAWLAWLNAHVHELLEARARADRPKVTPGAEAPGPGDGDAEAG